MQKNGWTTPSLGIKKKKWLSRAESAFLKNGRRVRALDIFKKSQTFRLKHYGRPVERTDKLRPIAWCWLVIVWIYDKALSQMTDMVYRLEYRKIFRNKSIICIDKNAENAMKC